MPAGYERVRDAIKKRLVKEGMDKEAADREAKQIAAAWWNKHNPDDPVYPGRESKRKGNKR